MDKDLFGNDIQLPLDPASEELKHYDEGSFTERLDRLKFINKTFPFGQREYGSDESFRIFNESLHCFIFGQYIATVILSLSFIERRFQEYFHIRNDSKAKWTLSQLLKEFKNTGFIDSYFIDRIDSIRLKRNPFVHHKAPLADHTLLSRSFAHGHSPDDLLEKDAKESLKLMLTISTLKII